MNISKDTFIILRYLNWRRSLLEHPDYQALFERMRKGKVPYTTDRTCPTLKTYSSDDSRPETQQIFDLIHNDWGALSEAFSFRVALLSKSFFNEVILADSAFDKNPKLCIDYLSGKTFGGTLIIPHINNCTVSYRLTYDEKGLPQLINILQLNADAIVAYIDNSTAFVSNETTIVKALDASKKQPDKVDCSQMDATLYLRDSLLSFLTCYILFCHFADVREKILPLQDSKQVKSAIKDRRDIEFTDSPVSVRRMDTTYFTTAVKTDGFPRRGFFRLQPYKIEGETVHRLKWINATFVSGYTRKARMAVNLESSEISKK